MSCPACFTGYIHLHEKPTGSMQTIYGRSTYVANPPEGKTPKGVVVIVPDAFGLPFPNNKLLADIYAREGPFQVYLPDFMDNTQAPMWMIDTFPKVLATATAWDWISKPYHIAWTLYGFIPFAIRNRFSVAHPKVTDYLAKVRAAKPDLPIGTAGFCWGGLHTVYLAHGEKDPKTGKVYSDACFTAHPSNLTVPSDIQKVTGNLSIAAAGKDDVFPIKQAHESEAILKELTKKTGVPTEVLYYENAGHGFGVRADPTDKEQDKHMKICSEQAVRWFSQRFADWKP